MIYQRCAEARRHAELLSEQDISAMFQTHARVIRLPRIIHGGLIFYFGQIALTMGIYKIPRCVGKCLCLTGETIRASHNDTCS